MNIWSKEKYLEAWYFATQKHTGQSYGGSQDGEKMDYIAHIGAVTMEVIWTLQHSEEQHHADLAVQCAILHDTIEDTETSYAEIKNKFGETVAKGVLALSKDKKSGDSKQQMSDSIQRIKAQGKEIWLVKMADRSANLHSPPYYWTKDKIQTYQQEAQYIYEKLADADKIMAQRLKQRIDDYTEFL